MMEAFFTLYKLILPNFLSQCINRLLSNKSLKLNLIPGMNADEVISWFQPGYWHAHVIHSMVAFSVYPIHFLAKIINDLNNSFLPLIPIPVNCNII